VFADECDLLLFRSPLIFFRDRYDEVRDAVEVGDALVIGVVGNDQRDFAAKFATLVAVEQILQAMVILRNEDRDAGAVGGVCEPPVYLEVAGDESKSIGKLGKVKIEICRVELYPGQKEIGFLLSMLIGEQDVAVVAKDKFSNRGNDAFAVGAGDEKDGGVVHYIWCVMKRIRPSVLFIFITAVPPSAPCGCNVPFTIQVLPHNRAWNGFSSETVFSPY
jgi:hypothetical protein